MCHSVAMKSVDAVVVFQTAVSWWSVEGNVTSVELVLPPDADSMKHVFGIALQTVDGYSSGVAWQHCTYQLTSS